MGNIVNTFKRFLGNKNTVTILGVLLGLVVLFVGYNYRVEHAVEKVSIPYAKKTLTSTTAITADAVGTMEVLRSMVTSNKSIISNVNSVVSTSQAFCVSEMTSIPQGGFFYQEQVKPCTSVTNNILRTMPEGYQPVSVPVDLLKTYGNSMFPGDYIDLYAKMTDSAGKLVYGLFISKLPILDVRDSSVFYDTTASKVPSLLTFAVPNYEVDGVNLYLLLSKAILLGNRVVEIIPVPKNAAYSSEKGETRVNSEWIKDQIMDYTASIPDEEVYTNPNLEQ